MLVVSGIIRETSARRKMDNLVRLYAVYYVPFIALFTILFVVPQLILSLFFGDAVILERIDLFFYAPVFAALLIAMLPLMPIIVATGLLDGNEYAMGQTASAFLNVLIVAVLVIVVGRYLKRMANFIVGETRNEILGIDYEYKRNGEEGRGGNER